ncbi:hypothetical protein [Streptomyces sp. DH37]|jgi:hypothetical protein|nr:hypothetical protein [Streptomyces sp. DH37]MDG9701541.1 hypothetical protein [Streptomyces sp. DH37]
MESTLSIEELVGEALESEDLPQATVVAPEVQASAQYPQRA